MILESILDELKLANGIQSSAPSKEYQPILNKVNKSIIPWMTLDELHKITLDTVLIRCTINPVTVKRLVP